MLKRGFDAACALLALMILSPILVPVAILLALTGEHEVLYRQERVGKAGKPFGVLKFVTMLKNSAALPGGDITIRNDPRVLPVGRILRKTKINELPQLLNILFGDMSIIGPRPLTPRIYSRFPEVYRLAMNNVRPGLSGIGSIFFRNEEEMLQSAIDREAIYFDTIQPFKAKLELWYAEHQSFWTDLKLIVITMLVVLRPGSVNLQRSFDSFPQVPPAVAKLVVRSEA